jgi:hypothetical protein
MRYFNLASNPFQLYVSLYKKSTADHNTYRSYSSINIDIHYSIIISGI